MLLLLLPINLSLFFSVSARGQSWAAKKSPSNVHQTPSVNIFGSMSSLGWTLEEKRFSLTTEKKVINAHLTRSKTTYHVIKIHSTQAKLNVQKIQSSHAWGGLYRDVNILLICPHLQLRKDMYFKPEIEWNIYSRRSKFNVQQTPSRPSIHPLSKLPCKGLDEDIPVIFFVC